MAYTLAIANSYRLCKGCRFEISGRLTVLFHVLALHNHVQAMMHLRTKTSHIKGAVVQTKSAGVPLHDMEKVWWYLFSFSPAACIHCMLSSACFGHNDHDVGSQSLAVTQHKDGVNFYVSDRMLY
jgi:hypothetical protein